MAPSVAPFLRAASAATCHAHHVCAMNHAKAVLGLPDACLLPQAWSGRSAWRMLEVRGTSAARFLQTWYAWRNDPHRCRMLHYVVIVGDHTDFIASEYASGDPLAVLANELLQQSWGLLAGLHRLAFDAGQVLLTVCVGEAASFLRQQTWRFDSIFWQISATSHSAESPIHTLKSLARCSAKHALLVASGATSPPPKDLAECGFFIAENLQLPDGINTAWAYRYTPTWQAREVRSAPRAKTVSPGRCIVIGAGLSGAAAAASLARRGWRVTVLDAAGAPAAGASGLPVGLFVSNLSADDNLVARISRAGVRATQEQCAQLLKPGVDWLDSGVLERRPTGKPGLPRSWSTGTGVSDGAAADWAFTTSAEHAVAAGLSAGSQAVQHVRAGWIKPERLVRALLAQPGVSFQAHGQVQQLQWRQGQEGDTNTRGLWCAIGPDGTLLGEAELIVVACGPASSALLQTAGIHALPLNAIRGQLSWGMQDGTTTLPNHPVNGHGALIAQVPVDGGLAWHAGSTFERECAHLPVSTQEQARGHAINFENLQALLPAAADALAPTFAQGSPALRHWAGVRCTVPDRLPLVGPVAPDTHPGLWLCTGMGARGLSRAVLCGELLAAQWHGEPLPVESRLAAAMAANRFRPPTK